MKKISYISKEKLEAIQYTGQNIQEVSNFIYGFNTEDRLWNNNDTISIKNKDGIFTEINKDDWIVKTILGFAIYDDKKFKSTFDKVEEYIPKKCIVKQELEFVRFYDNNYDEVKQFIGNDNIIFYKDNYISINTEYGPKKVYPGAYIVKTIRDTLLVFGTIDFFNSYNIVE
jgi:hypothetical protein